MALTTKKPAPSQEETRKILSDGLQAAREMVQQFSAALAELEAEKS